MHHHSLSSTKKPLSPAARKYMAEISDPHSMDLVEVLQYLLILWYGLISVTFTVFFFSELVLKLSFIVSSDYDVDDSDDDWDNIQVKYVLFRICIQIVTTNIYIISSSPLRSSHE